MVNYDDPLMDEILRNEIAKHLQEQAESLFRQTLFGGEPKENKRVEMSVYTWEHMKDKRVAGIVETQNIRSLLGFPVRLMDTVPYGRIALISGDRRQFVDILEG